MLLRAIGFVFMCAGLFLSVASLYLKVNRGNLLDAKFLGMRRGGVDPDTLIRYFSAGAFFSVVCAAVICLSTFRWLEFGMCALNTCILYVAYGRRKVLDTVAEMAQIAHDRLGGGKGGRP